MAATGTDTVECFSSCRQRREGVAGANLALCREWRGLGTDVEGNKLGVTRRARSVKIPIAIEVVSGAQTWTLMGVTDEMTAPGLEDLTA